jgi:hypothetical protein
MQREWRYGSTHNVGTRLRWGLRKSSSHFTPGEVRRYPLYSRLDGHQSRSLWFWRRDNLLLYAFFWVIPRRLNFVCRRSGTLCSIFIGGWIRRMTSPSSYLPAYEDGTDRVFRNVIKKISYPAGIRTPDRPAGTSQSLYRLRCSGSQDSFLPQISHILILSVTAAQPIPVAVRSEE